VGAIEIYWWLITQTHNLVLLGSYYVESLNVKAVNTPYRNMFSLMSTLSFVSELRSKIEKPMSKFVCQQSWQTLVTKVVPRPAATVGWVAHAQAVCNNGIPRGDYGSNQHIKSLNFFCNCVCTRLLWLFIKLRNFL